MKTTFSTQLCRFKQFTLGLCFGICALPAYAEVIQTNAHSFDINIESTVNASPEQAYSAFLRVEQWWNPEHSWFGSSKNFSLNPIAGGCFCEKSGDNQVQHMQVVFVKPTQEVKLLGALGPLQMMAANGAMRWTFKATASNKTLITQTYRVTALDTELVKMLATAVNGVQQQQQQRLVDYIARTSNSD